MKKSNSKLGAARLGLFHEILAARLHSVRISVQIHKILGVR